MNGKKIFLINALQNDIDAITQIYEKLTKSLEQDSSDIDELEDILIVRSYHLHSIYTAFENVFQNVATVFENSVDQPGRWHAQLLERMQMDMSPMRPAVIDKQAYKALDELRRFRHMFRHAYTVELDDDRLGLVIKQAQNLQKIYKSQLETFLNFVETLD